MANDSPGHATPDDPSGVNDAESDAHGDAGSVAQGGAESLGHGGAESVGQGAAGSPGHGGAGSLGDGQGQAGSAEADDDGTSGAVGVGTGGSSQRQSDSDGCTVRTGSGVAETGGAGVPITGSPGESGISAVRVGAGARCAARLRFTGPAPSPVFEVAVAAGGNVPATVVWVSNELSPFTTPRYAPAAPATASTMKPVITVARRGGPAGRRGATRRVRASSGSRQPKVFMPVEVMSGSPDNGADRHWARVLRNSLIGSVLRSHRTGVLPVRRCSGTL